MSEDNEPIQVDVEIEWDKPPADPPPMFDWNTAHDLMHKIGPDKALVLGLAMVSEQLDYMTRRIVNG